MLMFWGVDKATVASVSLQLNGSAFYDGPLAPLERVKEQRGLGHVEPVIVFFSQDHPQLAVPEHGQLRGSTRSRSSSALARPRA